MAASSPSNPIPPEEGPSISTSRCKPSSFSPRGDLAQLPSERADVALKGLVALEEHAGVNTALEGLPHYGGCGLLVQEHVHSVPDPPACRQREGGSCIKGWI